MGRARGSPPAPSMIFFDDLVEYYLALCQDNK
jgi:hypothetical protein